MSSDNNFEGWTNSELADALIENDEFLNERVGEGQEDKVWQWDRADLLDYVGEYLVN